MVKKSEMSLRPLEHRRYYATAAAIAELRDNAIAASTNKEKGDSWTRSHGCIIGDRVTVMFPANSKYYVHPYQPDPANEANYARHVAGANPRTVVQLCDEIAYLRGIIEEAGLLEDANSGYSSVQLAEIEGR